MTYNINGKEIDAIYNLPSKKSLDDLDGISIKELNLSFGLVERGELEVPAPKLKIIGAKSTYFSRLTGKQPKSIEVSIDCLTKDLYNSEKSYSVQLENLKILRSALEENVLSVSIKKVK